MNTLFNQNIICKSTELTDSYDNDIPYYKLVAVSSSRLKEFLQKKRPSFISSPAMVDGTILHAMILEGKTFESLCANVGHFERAYGKAYDDAIASAKKEYGYKVIPLKHSDFIEKRRVFNEMSEIARDFLITYNWLENVEMTAMTTLFNTPCKGIFDAIKVDETTCTIEILDYKTTKDNFIDIRQATQKSLFNTIRDFYYHIQAYFYLLMAENIYKNKWNVEFVNSSFTWLVQSKEMPYNVLPIRLTKEEIETHLIGAELQAKIEFAIPFFYEKLKLDNEEIKNMSSAEYFGEQSQVFDLITWQDLEEEKYYSKTLLEAFSEKNNFLI